MIFLLSCCCSYIGALLSGTSQLHLTPDGTPVDPPPAADVVTDEVVRAAIAENLDTPHTAAVGVLLQSSPVDSSRTEKHEVPLQVGAVCRSRLVNRLVLPAACSAAAVAAVP